MTAKPALAHLHEIPNLYTRVGRMEKEADELRTRGTMQFRDESGGCELARQIQIKMPKPPGRIRTCGHRIRSCMQRVIGGWQRCTVYRRAVDDGVQWPFAAWSQAWLQSRSSA